MINPQYKSQTRDHDFPVAAGDYIYCPACKKILMQAVAEKIKIRCKHCRKWVFLEKKLF